MPLVGILQAGPARPGPRGNRGDLNVAVSVSLPRNFPFRPKNGIQARCAVEPGSGPAQQGSCRGEAPRGVATQPNSIGNKPHTHLGLGVSVREGNNS